jgi:hypothetical protein
MIARIVTACAFVFGSAVGVAQAANIDTPAPPEIFVDLTISFSPTPPEIIPSDARMTGVASFFNSVHAGDQVLNFGQGGFDIGSLLPGQSFTTTFLPPNPCFGTTSCSFNFSFTGLTGSLFGPLPTLALPTDTFIPLPPRFFRSLFRVTPSYRATPFTHSDQS